MHDLLPWETWDSGRVHRLLAADRPASESRCRSQATLLALAAEHLRYRLADKAESVDLPRTSL